MVCINFNILMDNTNSSPPFRKALFLIFLSGLSYLFLDRELLPLIGSHPFPIWKVFSFLIYPPLHLLLWTGAFIIARIKQSHWTLPLFEITVSQCLSVAFARVFKILLGRARPDIFLKKGVYGFHGLEWSHHYHSFPSGHTLTAFILATSLVCLFPRFRILFYSLATLLSLSRPFLLDHYLSDVIATASIGMIIASFVHIMTRRIHYETS
ncbi:MAG: phosphatase PAP2 family protein [Candidatus Neptunochlamydia sp.]|nr:phosphatase PAP2 family protein [Candidatus Neptunochlamydia sp.]